jgi:myo-inositol-1(or 4)-monophosphatase|tara:strand:+ start:27241 stop:28017 length:777 start_codon:yes stop_codon:yes gene_type:complete
MVNIALRAAREAEQLISRAIDRPDLVKITEKSPQHYVTNVDLQAEEIIIETLKANYPLHSFLGEESGLQQGSDEECLWIIDPLDGSNNFVHGIPHFAISIAFEIRGRVEHALILDPIRHEVFTASRGASAQINDSRIRVTDRISLEGAIVGTDLPPGSAVADSQADTIGSLQQQGAAIRQSGCGSLDLAYIAAGRLDALWLLDRKQWQLAAGCLMVTEAGGLVSDFSGGQNYGESGNLVSGTPKCFKPLLQTVARTFT